MKKMVISLLFLICIISVTAIIYVWHGSVNIRNNMIKYLNSQEYSEMDIEKIKVNHSFLNIILSYDEWTVQVEYKDQPTIIYYYTYKNKKIVQAGVSGGNFDKKDLKHIK